jgi:hypothetical protein
VKRIKEYAWILAFMFLVLPALATRLEAQREPTMRASVRPNVDSTGSVPPKINPALPWVSEYQQPAIYAEWWKKIAACEHLILPVELTKAVHFVQINSETFTRGLKAEWLYGYTQPEAGLTIFIAQSVVNEYETVAHEMLHLIAYWNGLETGADYHPPDLFETCSLHTTHA